MHAAWVELGFGFEHTPPARRVRRTIGFIMFIAEIIPNRYRYDSESKTYFRILQRGQEPSHNDTLLSVYRSPVHFRTGKLREFAGFRSNRSSNQNDGHARQQNLADFPGQRPPARGQIVDSS